MSERFGKYELLQRIGVGGMAEVWVARTYGAQGFVKELVIKRILEQFNEDEDFVSMFINEARLASRLQHANIVQIFDFDQVDGVYYIAMEFVDGPDLRKVAATARRRKMPAPLTLAVHVGVEALKGLHYAHTRQERGRPLGIVHRDISPHNLLLSYAGEVKVTDFGIAKVAALASATRTGMVKGKLTYMSPEQVRAEGVDARADIYALGIVLWELLAGRRFYKDVGSEGELLAAARQGVATALEEVAPEVPPELARAVERMLAPDPEERFSSAAEALAELSAFAGATDALEVADYLGRLLPGAADRERRGQTALHQQEQQVVAAPDAPTGTLDEGQADVRSDADLPRGERVEAQPEAPAAAAQGGLEVVEAGPRALADEPASVRRGGWALPLAVAALVLAGSAAASWWLVVKGRAAAAPALASLEIHSKPPGATLTVNRAAVGGRAPQTLSGFQGARLAVEARWPGGQTRRRDVTLTSGTQRITLHEDPSAGRRGRAAKPPSEPKVVAQKRGLDGSIEPDLGVVAKAPKVAKAPEGKRRHSGKGKTSRRRRPGKGRTFKPRWPKVDKRPQPKTVVKTPVAPPKVKRGFGALSVQVSPWAYVYVDGKKIGLTPITRYRLAVGRHRIRVVNKELGKKAVISARIEKGRTFLVRRDW